MRPDLPARAARSITRWTTSILPRRDEERQRRVGLPDALERLARALRAGSPPAEAFRSAADGAAGPLGEDLRRVAVRLEAGVSRRSALAEWVQRSPSTGVRLATAAVGLGSDVGGSRSRAVDRVAVSLRSRAAVEREVRALAAQARLSALVIALAPLVFGVLGLLGDPSMASFLVGTPVGLSCLVGGIVLDVAAVVWMRRIVRRVVP
ncbi:MAG: type II secretion system F family protein [Acidimicrobiia bacterium]|nr:type II secretion system F family protein [Acidimicrobiia bacterium]